MQANGNHRALAEGRVLPQAGNARTLALVKSPFAGATNYYACKCSALGAANEVQCVPYLASRAAPVMAMIARTTSRVCQSRTEHSTAIAAVVGGLVDLDDLHRRYKWNAIPALPPPSPVSHPRPLANYVDIETTTGATNVEGCEVRNAV